MAKGNDGNFLQHRVEVCLADRLAKQGGGSLHVGLTHGMAPYEICEQPSSSVQHDKLDQSLRLAAQDARDEDPPIVRAYRACRASRDRYPNTAELLAETLGRGNLFGCITEVDHETFLGLQEAWQGSHVAVQHASWREHVIEGGGLRCPDELKMPWLFTMDPMSWRTGETADGVVDDAQLRPSDVDLLEAVLAEYVQSGQPGAAAIFVYKVSVDLQPDFWLHMGRLAEATSMRAKGLSNLYNGGNRNLAAVLTTPSPSGLAAYDCS